MRRPITPVDAANLTDPLLTARVLLWLARLPGSVDNRGLTEGDPSATKRCQITRSVTQVIADPPASDQLWIYFVAGTIRSTSRQQAPPSGINSEASRFLQRAKDMINTGVRALYRRGVVRIAKYPFDFRPSSGEYQTGTGGEWWILRDGVVYQTDPQRIDEPILYPELTPFDALEAAEQMTITETTDGENLFGPCKRLIGDAHDATAIPELWSTHEPLAVEVQIDERGLVRRIDIEAAVAARNYRLVRGWSRVPAPSASLGTGSADLNAGPNLDYL